MPQDKTIDAAGKEINTQNAVRKADEARKAGMVMPFDKQKVYATETLVKAGIASEVGQEMEVHPEHAKKLIASKKATAEAPAKSEAKNK